MLARLTPASIRLALPMLAAHANSIVTFFAADFKPRIGFLERTAIVAAFIEEQLEDVTWQMHGTKFLIREKAPGLLIIADHNRLACQTLGLASWSDRLERNSDLVRACLDRYGCAELARVGFKLQGYFDLKMTQKEIETLLNGTYLVDKEILRPILGDLSDVILHYEGKINGFDHSTFVTPMSSEQARLTFMAIPNLRAMVEDPLLDTSIIERRDWISRDALFMDMDLSKKDVKPAEIRPFIKESLPIVDETVEKFVKFLKTLPADGVP